MTPKPHKEGPLGGPTMPGGMGGSQHPPSHPPTPINSASSPGAVSMNSQQDEFETVNSPGWPRSPSTQTVGLLAGGLGHWHRWEDLEEENKEKNRTSQTSLGRTKGEEVLFIQGELGRARNRGSQTSGRKRSWDEERTLVLYGKKGKNI